MSKLSMLKYFIGSVFIVCGFASMCQDTCKISLGKFSIKSKIISVKISEVVDARKDKNTIGVVQIPSQNQKDTASFYLLGLKEVEELLTRSDLVSSEGGFLIRIRNLAISEFTDAGKENFKAELYVEFFRQVSNYYYPYQKISTSNQSNSATRSHAENIVEALKGALNFFSVNGGYTHYEQPFIKEDLMDPDLNFR
jgi:hypothetical protein